MALLRSLPSRPVRHVLTDMDDTVVGSARALEGVMAQALESLVRKGMGLAVVSGAALDRMLGTVSARLQVPHYLVATSGSQAVESKGRSGGPPRGLFHHAFSPQDRQEILAALRWLVGEKSLVPDTDEADQLQDRGSQITLSGIGYTAGIERKRAFDPDCGRRREWVALLTKRLGAGRFNLRIGGTTSLDITPLGVDKGSGVGRLLELAGWRASDCLYFGDRFDETGNDHPLLALMDCVEIRHPAETLAFFQELAAGPKAA
jgi:phosphomannomutase